MNKTQILTAVILLPVLLACCPLQAKQLIAVGEKNRIRLFDDLNRETATVLLPARLESQFRMKGSVICFFGDDLRLHWFNWKTRTERSLPPGPYVYSTPGMGPEICMNIDFSESAGIMVADIKPLWISAAGSGAGKRIDGEELDSLWEICLIRLDSGQKKLFSPGKGYRWNPLIVNHHLAYASTGSVLLQSLNMNREVSLNSGYANEYRSGREVFLSILGVSGDRLVFFEYAGRNIENPAVLAIACFNPKDSSFEMAHDLISDSNRILFSLPRAISGDFNRLLLVDDSGRVFLYHLGTRRFTDVFRAKSGKVSVQFYQP